MRLVAPAGVAFRNFCNNLVRMDLRARFREVEAQPSGGAWSRLAAALAREGEPLRAYEAACRALAFDGGDPAGNFVFPAWAQVRGDWAVHASVPWRGLRSLTK